MRKPGAACCVTALRHQQGHLVPPGVGQADIMGRHYAAISKAVEPDPVALQQVLDAIPDPPLHADLDADALGSLEVHVAEVVGAWKHSRPGTSPGPDGIPLEMYRRAGQGMAALLSRLFVAMLTTCQTPAKFLDGCITSIHKDGDRANPANYRPITLLNTDYRLLAKILANRCLNHTAHLISLEQSAFLKGRSIADSIMMLQLLPHALKAAGAPAGALVAFLDFTKAYDTISRAFLTQIMLKLGVSGRFVDWVKMLLSDTRACAVVNGFRSSRMRFHSGVRQGCPLAPVLYLFVGEALLRFLQAQPGLGITLPPNTRVVAGQHADDVKVVLRDRLAAGELVLALHTFGAASGQQHNLGKCALLPLDDTPIHTDVPPPQDEHHAHPAYVAGMPVKARVTSLGIQFQAGLQPAQPGPGWDDVVGTVDKKIDKLKRLPLSRFGRALGATSYVVSKLLFYTEFVGLPTPTVLAALQTKLAYLVDRRLNASALTHVPGTMLLGSPKQGGFGLVGIQQHTVARHAVLACRMLTSNASLPWVSVAHMLIRHHGQVDNHAWNPATCIAMIQHGLLPLANMPAPLHRLLYAVGQLNAVQNIANDPPTPITLQHVHAAHVDAGMLGWLLQGDEARPGTVVPMHELCVRHAYSMLLAPTAHARTERWRDFLVQALGLSSAAEVTPTHLACLQRTLQLLWKRVAWHNERKQLYWQLILNALPFASRFPNLRVRECGCHAAGRGNPGRLHHFWECPAAQAVVLVVCTCLEMQQLDRRQLWLMQPPRQLMRFADGVAAPASARKALREVWCVVCLAAMHAMWHTAGRVMIETSRTRLASGERDIQDVMRDSAVAHFWDALWEFARSTQVPAAWRASLPHTSPFLYFPPNSTVLLVRQR
jgi:hypothetical protein